MGSQALLSPTVRATVDRPPRPAAMLAVLLTGQAMATMDTSIANVIGPVLRDDLGISDGPLQLVIAGFVLAYGVLLITGARLGDDYGYRRIFRAGLILFTVASLACGMASGATSLLVARVIQGVGAALLVPQVLSLIQRSFEGAERARVIGYFSTIMATGVTLGQLLGGAVATVDLFGLGWRAAFLINVPIGIVLLWGAGKYLPEARSATPRRLDYGGIVLLSASMTSLLVPLTIGREAGWPAWTAFSFAGGAVGLVLFLAFETFIERKGGAPLFDIAAMTSNGVGLALLILFLGFIGYGGLLFTVSIHVQTGLGFSPLVSGLVFCCFAAGFGGANLFWSRLPAKALRWMPALAALLFAAAAAMLGLVMEGAPGLPPLALVLLLVCGIGQGLGFGPIVSLATQRIPPRAAPTLSGVVVTTVQLAIVTGIAGLGGLYFLPDPFPGVLHTPTSGLPVVAMAVAAANLLAAAGGLMLAATRPAKGNE